MTPPAPLLEAAKKIAVLDQQRVAEGILLESEGEPTQGKQKCSWNTRFGSSGPEGGWNALRDSAGPEQREGGKGRGGALCSGLHRYNCVTVGSVLAQKRSQKCILVREWGQPASAEAPPTAAAAGERRQPVPGPLGQAESAPGGERQTHPLAGASAGDAGPGSPNERSSLA